MKLGHPERSEAESKDPAALALSISTGLKAWPRGLRPLRCSLDFTRNDTPFIGVTALTQFRFDYLVDLFELRL